MSQTAPIAHMFHVKRPTAPRPVPLTQRRRPSRVHPVLPSVEEQLRAELQSLDARHRLRSAEPFAGPNRVSITAAGEPLVSFCSNDYLGLASHPIPSHEAHRVAERSGIGAGGARLISGTSADHLDLEHSIATLVGTEAALLFPSGYHANIGLITTLARPGDLIVADRSVHASIIDGCRLSRAKLALFRHGDATAAERHLLHLGPRARRRLLITESLFSMEGDSPPLAHLAALARRYEALFVVDEAHAIGTLGPRGAGLCFSHGAQPDALVGTLGKALGVAGAFVAGSTILRAYLLNHSRSFLFTTAPPPPLAAAAAASVRLSASPEGDRLRASLRHSVDLLRSSLGLPPDPVGSPILPIILGPDLAALTAATYLRSQGFLVQPVRPPTVRDGTARLRITLSALHSPQQVTALAAALARLPRPSSPSYPSRSAPPEADPRGDTPGLVLLGTDTAVGKSATAAALLRLLALRGHRPTPFKPVETGAAPLPSDATLLRDAAIRPDIPLHHVCPFPFPSPVAPLAASEEAGHPITLASLLAAARVAASHGSPIVIESAGGLMTPYNETLSSVGLASALGYPVLLVARNALGTINHTALSVAEIRRRGLPFVGVLLVTTSPLPSADQASNAALIARVTGQAPLGILPYVASPTPDKLASALADTVDLSRLLALIEASAPKRQ